jgi:glycosyltransferase involved in cell wall biosynthesis
LTVLYITQNGVTTHIGQSQVTPYLLGLARSGVRITLLSSEPGNQQEQIEKHEKIFSQVGIRWKRVLYQNTPKILGPVLTQRRLSRAALQIVKQGGISIVHCRSHPPSLIGYYLKRVYNIHFIFDFRDFYADWGLLNTKGIKRLFYIYIKKLEGTLIRSADKVVCLTHRASRILSDSYLIDEPGANGKFIVIPCCADFNYFDLSKVSNDSVSQLRTALRIPENSRVLVYLGSLGTDYLLGPMVALFRILLVLQPDSYFLFICNNGNHLITDEFEKQGVSNERMRIVNSSRDMVPQYLALADLSVIFIRADHTKAGCSPTKLAELLACNIPVIANSGVGDLDVIISPSRNNSVLVSDFTERSLADALQKINSLIEINKNKDKIRINSYEFSLEEGVQRYLSVYRELA